MMLMFTGKFLSQDAQDNKGAQERQVGSSPACAQLKYRGCQDLREVEEVFLSRLRFNLHVFVARGARHGGVKQVVIHTFFVKHPTGFLSCRSMCG